jgi:hypothetical protein
MSTGEATEKTEEEQAAIKAARGAEVSQYCVICVCLDPECTDILL